MLQCLRVMSKITLQKALSRRRSVGLRPMKRCSARVNFSSSIPLDGLDHLTAEDSQSERVSDFIPYLFDVPGTLNFNQRGKRTLNLATTAATATAADDIGGAPSPASSDGSIGSVSDGTPPLSPSISLDSAPGSDGSSAPELEPEPEPIFSSNHHGRVRVWPDSDDIALLEVVSSHREKHGRLPSANDLAAALRGRLSAVDNPSAEQVDKRLRALRCRYDDVSKRLKRGTIPATDVDVTIYRLSKRIWEGTRRGKMEKKTPAAVADAREVPREFAELAELYPCLAAEVESIDARFGHGTLKRAFGRMGDETAARLEDKFKIQRVLEARSRAKRDRLTAKVAEAFLAVKK